MAATSVPSPAGIRITENQWRGTIAILSAAVLLITVWCLVNGITIIFMHLYYFPIVLLAYRYRWTGFYYATLLALAYLLLVIILKPAQPDIVYGAVFRFLVFIGIAAVVAFLSDLLSRQRETARRLQQFQESVIANANIWIAVLAPDGSILLWNEAAEQISGYLSTDVVGKKTVWKQLYPDKEYRRKIASGIERIIAKEKYLENFETVIRCADGSGKTIAWNTRSLKDENGTITGYIALGRDVTAQKDAEQRVEESAGFLSTMLDTLPMPVFYKDKSGRYLGCNPPFEEYIGIKRENLIGKSVYDISPKDLADRYAQADRQVFENPVPQTYETQVQYADGSRHDVIFIKAPFFDRDGSVAGLIGAIIDISERKRMETSLQESEDRILLVLNSAAEAIFGEDLSGNCTFCNAACLKMLGYHREEDLLGKNMHWQIHGKRANGSVYPVEECRMFRAQKEGRGVHVDDEVLWRADGTSFPVEYWSYPQKKDGRVIGAVVTFMDITERKQAEKTLRESEEKYRAFFSTSQDCVFITTADGTLADVNDVAVRMFGYESRQDLLGTNALALYANPDERAAHLKSVSEKGFSFDYPVDMKKKNGTVIHTLITSAVRRDASGTVIGYQGTIRDISDRKADEDRIRDLLRVQQEQLRIINTSPAVSFLWRAEENWQVEMVSDNISQFGYTPDDFLSGRILFSAIIHPDDLARIGAEVEYNSSNHIDEYKQVYRILGADRTEYWIDDYTHIRRDGTGRITHYEGIILDITDRRQAEEALEKNRRQLVEAMDLAKQAHWEFDIASGIFTFNDRFYALYGTSAEREGGYEMPADVYAREFVHPDDGHLVADEVKAAQETSDPNFSSRVEHRIIRRDGEIRHIIVRIGVTLDKGGRPVKTHGVNQDITEQKRAALALIESEQKFREIFDNANDAIEIVGIRDDGSPGRFIDLNAVACRMLQYTKEELLGRGPLEINTDTFSRPFPDILAELHTAGHATFETGHRRKDGTAFPVEVNAHIVTLLGKKVILSVVRDITERRAAEAEIRQSRQLFADIISFLPDPTIVIDKEGKVLAWNRAIEKLSGTPAEDIIGRGDHAYSIWLYGKRRPILIDLVLHPDQDAGRMNYLNIRRDGSTITAETTATLQSGKEIVLSLVASPLYGENGEITGAIESMRDITRIKETEAELARINANLEKIVRERTQALQDEIVQRKYAEAEAQDALAYTRSVIEANPDMMVVLDAEGRILDVNAAGTILTGIPREDLLGQPYFGYLEDDGTLETAFERLLAQGSIENFVRIRHTDGHRTPLSVHAVVVKGSGSAPDRIIVSAHDITKQKADEAAITASLEEKVILLREIHHRVKNNLQIIISLTNLQMRKAEDPAVKQMMAETQNRVRAMSLVHEKLYRSGSLSRIDFADYARFLATQLMSFFAVDPQRVALDIRVDPIMVDIDRAVPLGLIMNELVSNALKHAFPGGRPGTLSISGGIENGTLAITVQDDGVGLPGGVDWKNSGTLGMQLVLGLVDQIGGTMTVETGTGTRFTITIKDIREIE